MVASAVETMVECGRLATQWHTTMGSWLVEMKAVSSVVHLAEKLVVIKVYK